MAEAIQSLFARYILRAEDDNTGQDASSTNEDVQSEHFKSDWEEEAEDGLVAFGNAPRNEYFRAVGVGQFGGNEEVSSAHVDLVRGIFTHENLQPQDKKDEITRVLSSYQKNEIQTTDIRADMIRKISHEQGKRNESTHPSWSQLQLLLPPNSATLLIPDRNGCNAAHRACLLDYVTYATTDQRSLAVILFLEEIHDQRFVNIDQTTGDPFDRRTCLHLAVDNGLGPVVDWLLDNRASVRLKDNKNMTAWDIACENQNAEAMGILAADHLTEKPTDPWFRMRESGVSASGDVKLIMKKYYFTDRFISQLKAHLGGKDIAEPQLFTVSANKALLAKIHKIGKFENETVRRYFSFVQSHFQQRDALRTRLRFREPIVAFKELSGDELGMMSIAMPYFYSGKLMKIHKRRESHKKKTASRTCPDGETSRHGLQLPLTLDEYCNSSLSEEALDYRNEDQVVSRSAKRRWLEGCRKDGSGRLKKTQPATRVLMVHQIWIYRLGGTLIVAFPDIVMQEPTISDVLLGEGAHSRDPVKASAQLLSAFISLLETPVKLHEPVLDIYEESISNVSTDVDQYFKKSPKEQEKAADDEKQFLHDIADVREELAMVKSVVEQQEKVWADLKENIWSHWSSDFYFEAIELRDLVVETASKLNKFKERIDKADQNAERVQFLIPQYLELKRSYITMKESHYTALLGAAVFGLSLVTIVFTPMSFILALLAVPDDGLLMEPDRGKLDYLKECIGITEGTSLGATIVVMIWAWWKFRDTSRLRASEEKKAKKKDKKKREKQMSQVAAGRGNASGNGVGATRVGAPRTARPVRFYGDFSDDEESNAQNDTSGGGNLSDAVNGVPVAGGPWRRAFRSMLRGSNRHTDVEQGH